MQSSVDTDGGAPRAPYPMARRGGLFVALLGAGLILAIAVSGDALVNYAVFYAGAGLATLSLFFSRRLSSGKPTRLQFAALAAAIALEVALFLVLGQALPPGAGEHVLWLWALMIVGVHFVPMGICFGPVFALLGGACIANAALGLLLPTVPYELFGLVDGALKVVVGVGMARVRPSAA
jgi:hypothetical protein